MKNGTGTLHKRKQPKVIRYVHYDRNKGRANFFRELVMLFKPWRDEYDEIESQNCEDIHKEHCEDILCLYKIYGSW